MAYVVALVPARAGSKGVPDKNVRLLGGHPLIAYSVKAGVHARNVDRTLVSTDSREYSEIARQYGAETPFLRPSAFATDQSTDYEFVVHALDWFEQNERRVPDYIVQLRPTTPLRQIAVVEAAVDAMLKNAEATALRSVHEMSETAYKCFEIDGDRLKCVGSGSFELEAANRPRQDFPKTYHANGYVDVLKTSFIRAQRQIHGNRVAAFVTPAAVEIDAQADFDLLEFQIQRDRDLYAPLFR